MCDNEAREYVLAIFSLAWAVLGKKKCFVKLSHVDQDWVYKSYVLNYNDLGKKPLKGTALDALSSVQREKTSSKATRLRSYGTHNFSVLPTNGGSLPLFLES